MREHALHLLGSRSRPRLPLAEKIASARLDVLLFSGAIAVVAAHAAADSFIAPEPGTGPSDHLLRGLATFSVLALAAVVYPRLRAGGRAALAAVLGALALEAAGLAIGDARAAGARGEDWTGFLLLPVGAALIALSAVLLWRTRKPGRVRYLRRAGLAVAAVLMRVLARHPGSNRDPRNASAARGSRTRRCRATLRRGDDSNERRP